MAAYARHISNQLLVPALCGAAAAENSVVQMDPAAAPPHLVAVPYPGRGHINPMLVLCRLLTAADSSITITVVVTEEWLGLLGTAGVLLSLPASVRLATIPNVIPSEHGRGADHTGFIEAVCTRMEEPFERLLGRLEPEPAAIVADTYLVWAVAAGRRRGIPVCSLWTMPATFFSALYHFEQWPPVDDHECADQSSESLEQYVSGLSSVRLADLKLMRALERPLKRALDAFSCVRKAQCVLLTSFYELESRVIDRLVEELPFPVYPIGPSIPHMLLKDSSDNTQNGIIHEEYSRWLDAQPKNAVLYVSLGSYVSVSQSQLDEIALGLHDSRITFFWVARGESTRLQKMCGDKGLVVPWCDQLKVLCHPSVGGFLSHCGWNSTLEATYAGLPLLSFPFFWDQLVNARLIADEWKIGINLKEKRGKDGIVRREEIAIAMKKLMDLDDTESQGMRRRASELREASRSAIQEGGSSHNFLNCFIKDLIDGKLNVEENFQ